MAKVALYNMEGTKTGDMEVSDAIFAAEVNKSVLHQVVVNYLANQRQGRQIPPAFTVFSFASGHTFPSFRLSFILPSL